jgi:hypothetical protein
VLMFWIGTHWREDEQPEVQTLIPESPGVQSGRNRVWLGAIVVVIAASVGVSARALIGNVSHDLASRPDISLPSTLGDWTAASGVSIDWKPHYESPDA